MKKQKICIIGDGLTGLSTALALCRLNIDIHLIIRPTTKNLLLDNRTTAISPSNHKFLMKHLKKTESRFFLAEQQSRSILRTKRKLLSFYEF